MKKIKDFFLNHNHYKYRKAYTTAVGSDRKTPVDVTLELASLCNMSCTYCYHSDKKNLPFQTGIMEYKTAEKIINQAADVDAYSMKFNWRGEPSLNPRFKDIVELSRSRARGHTLMERFTNSNFKFHESREDIFDGFAAMTKVKISYDSFNAEVFEKQRKGGIHEVTSNNIDLFYNMKGRKTEMVIQAVRTINNKDEDIHGLVKKRWPHASVSIRDMVEGRVNKDLESLAVKRRDHSERQSCVQAHARLIFSWDGKASPCCPDIGGSLAVGSIKDESVYDIWNGFKAKRLREMLLDKSAFKTDPCKNCSSFETFKGFTPNWES